MFRLIAIDGKEYGPVSAATIREWIAQGRADETLKVRIESDENWKPLGDFPEFSESLTEKKLRPPPVETSDETLGEEVAIDDYHLDIGECLRRSWSNFRRNIFLSLSISIAFCLLEFAVQRYVDIRTLTVAGAALLIVVYTVTRGISYIFLQISRGDGKNLRESLSRIIRSFFPLLIIGLVTTLLVTAGFLLFILPGLYFAVCWAFAPMLVLDKHASIYQALSYSRQRVSRHWWRCLWALIVFTFIGVSGVIFFFVGLLVTLPIMFGALAVAYDQIFPDSGTRPL